MTLPADQQSLTPDEQRALGLSPSKAWLALDQAISAVAQWTRGTSREMALAGQ